jgi:hypothetical protein
VDFEQPVQRRRMPLQVGRASTDMQRDHCVGPFVVRVQIVDVRQIGIQIGGVSNEFVATAAQRRVVTGKIQVVVPTVLARGGPFHAQQRNEAPILVNTRSGGLCFLPLGRGHQEAVRLVAGEVGCREIPGMCVVRVDGTRAATDDRLRVQVAPVQLLRDRAVHHLDRIAGRARDGGSGHLGDQAMKTRL